MGEDVLSGKVRHLKPSNNDYDWLGNGIYFWESDPWRALDFAEEAKANKHLTKGSIEDPYVVGAIIELGNCCNLLEVEALRELKEAYEYLDTAFDALGQTMPKNAGQQRGLRHLDKAVIETMHGMRARRKYESYDSVRAAFVEGTTLYPGAGFNGKNHIQIAVRTPNNIRGYFRLPGM